MTNAVEACIQHMHSKDFKSICDHPVVPANPQLQKIVKMECIGYGNLDRIQSISHDLIDSQFSGHVSLTCQSQWSQADAHDTLHVKHVDAWTDWSPSI